MRLQEARPRFSNTFRGLWTRSEWLRLTLFRMKCLMMKKRSPDMSPDSRGEMNQEATA